VHQVQGKGLFFDQEQEEEPGQAGIEQVLQDL
jgi:hypothetical protein